MSLGCALLFSLSVPSDPWSGSQGTRAASATEVALAGSCMPATIPVAPPVSPRSVGGVVGMSLMITAWGDSGWHRVCPGHREGQKKVAAVSAVPRGAAAGWHSWRRVLDREGEHLPSHMRGGSLQHDCVPWHTFWGNNVLQKRYSSSHPSDIASVYIYNRSTYFSALYLVIEPLRGCES